MWKPVGFAYVADVTIELLGESISPADATLERHEETREATSIED